MTSFAAFASVRAMSTVGTSSTSAASRAATRWRTACWVGIEHLAAEMAALLFGAELVFEVHAGRAGANHGLHQLEDVERAAEARFGVGDDRQVPAIAAAPLERLDLVETRQRVVEPFDERRNAVDGIEALIRIHLARERSRRRPLASRCSRAREVRRAPLARPDCRSASRAPSRARRLEVVATAARDPIRASVCSTTTLPCNRLTSPAPYRRSIPAPATLRRPARLADSAAARSRSRNLHSPSVGNIGPVWIIAWPILGGIAMMLGPFSVCYPVYRRALRSSGPILKRSW